MQSVKTPKGEHTRARILGTALTLFRQRGYDGTTMRAIAEQAGVSLGSAYYYFASKEHLIQAFYARTHDEHVAACESILADGKDLRSRLLGVMRAKLRTIEPYHRFAGVLFKTAADPESPLNPFSDEFREVREESTSLFARVVEGSTARVPKRLQAELPDLLWTYHMGIVLFWVHDDSPKRERSYRLVDQSVDLVAKLVAMSRLPVMSPLVTKALRMTSELRGPMSDAGGPDG